MRQLQTCCAGGAPERVAISQESGRTVGEYSDHRHHQKTAPTRVMMTARKLLCSKGFFQRCCETCFAWPRSKRLVSHQCQAPEYPDKTSRLGASRLCDALWLLLSSRHLVDMLENALKNRRCDTLRCSISWKIRKNTLFSDEKQRVGSTHCTPPICALVANEAAGLAKQRRLVMDRWGIVGTCRYCLHRSGRRKRRVNTHRDRKSRALEP